MNRNLPVYHDPTKPLFPGKPDAQVRNEKARARKRGKIARKSRRKNRR